MTIDHSIRQDVAFGARMLARQPGFTMVAVGALAIGIGANAAIFSLVDRALWRPLPFQDPGALVVIAEQRPRENAAASGPVSPADFLDWRDTSRAFTAMAATSSFVLNLAGGIGDPQRVRALAASPGFLEALGVAPAGRTFRRDEEDPGRAQVVILSDALWRTRFGGDPAIVGRTVLLNARPYEVIGVLPPRFRWTADPEVLVPLALDSSQRTRRTLHSFQVIARRAPNVSMEQAAADMERIGRELERQHPDDNRGHYPRVLPLRTALVGETRQALLVLTGAVGLVLLIACANVSTLLMARGSARRKEMAVRRALGAARGRIVRQCLTESLLLGLLGAGAGVLLAGWALSSAAPFLPASLSSLPGVDRVTIDARVLGAALAATLATAVIFGLVPALAAVDDDVARALNESGRSGMDAASTRRTRMALVVLETALSLVLLVGAGLLLVSFRHLVDVSPGFDPHGVVTMRVTLPGARYTDAMRIARFHETLLERLRAIPGVEAAGAVTLLPFGSGDSRSGFLIEGPTRRSDGPVRAHPRLVSAEYLRVLRVPLIKGRGFTERDADRAPEVVIINETAARRFWPGEDPIGRRISFEFATPRWLQIVGVIGDVKHGRLDADANPEAYLPYLQSGNAADARGMWFVVRTAASAAAIAPAMRDAVRALDADQPVGAIRPMDDLIVDSIGPQRLNFVLLTAFAAVALVLTAAGLYGVMAYLVTQRTREIGVRMALGASPRQVLALVAGQAGLLTLAGTGLGIAAALVLTRWLRALLFGVSPAEPRVYAAVSLLLGVVALVAVAIPSIRATRVDPVSALREG